MKNVSRIKDIRKIVSSSKQRHLRKGWRGPKGEIIFKYSDAFSDFFFSIIACLGIDRNRRKERLMSVLSEHSCNNSMIKVFKL